jgi:protein arginine kinase
VSNDIVVSSRIRLARNLRASKFSSKISSDESYKIIDDVKTVIEKNKTTSKLGFKLSYLKDIPEIEQNILVEQHIISPQLTKNKNQSAFMINKDKNITIMINEEDHLRIQVLSLGLNLEDGLKTANMIDDILEESLDYAYDKDLGYITSCPTNLGTGLRASTMLHLPALYLSNQLEKILLSISEIGVAVRGVYGEGTKSMGNLYQISNQGTLGASEETLVERIKQISLQLIKKENTIRRVLLKYSKIFLENEIYRAYGILKNARMIDTYEAMKLLSIVKLGIETEILENIDNKNIDKLITKIQDNNVQMLLEDGATPKSREVKRAEILREEL